MRITQKFEYGVDLLLRRRPRWFRSERLALVCHPASVDRQLVHTADRISDAGARLVALFGPQHGARGEKQDNMIESAGYRDRRLKIPVHSLYSTVREPTAAMLRGVDILLIDLQDVGTRVYTFVSTMVACLRAGKRLGRKVVVLDRPNPIGGVQVEGHALEAAFRSFVGEVPGMPMRHGMTIGEIARLANDWLEIDCELEVVTMEGWPRRPYWDSLGLHWVSPSPNVPTPVTALLYPGTVLFEGTNVSEGRGTTQPFECIGAPFIDPYRLVRALERRGLAGVSWRPVYFEPTFHKWHGELCGGVQIHVLDRERFEPYRAAVTLAAAIRQLYPRRFAWRDPPYEYEHERMPIDLICGTASVREGLSGGVPERRLISAAAADSARFLKQRSRYLLYE